MILITDQAIAKVKEIKETQERPEAGLRLFVAGGGCSGLKYGMSLDDPEDDDEVFDFAGLTVLVDTVSMQHLDGAIVDWVDTLMGSGFKIENPNAVSSCGCGHSFRTA